MAESKILKKKNQKALNVMFGDFSYYNRHTVHEQYVPLGIGLIAQYAKQQFGDNIDVSLFKRVDKFLEHATKNPPDVVGLSVYFWNTAMNRYIVKTLREMFGQDIIIILGGPSIDSDSQEQKKSLTETFQGANLLILNEGEISFSNIIRRTLENRDTVFKDPIDGAIFWDGKTLIKGKPIGLSMDLSTMGSPYLSGLMDEFMNSDYQPLLQTSRFCPYTCAFCVSGKNRGKLRGYPIEQVKEEIEYIAKKYADRPHHTLFLADENFGILKRDVLIAEALKKSKDDFGYPQSIFYYNDKRFTETSRIISEILVDQTELGLTLALQTENPLSLEAINRTNVTDDEISSAITWAKGKNLNISTELIFGMPHDTRELFVNMLDSTIKRGFDDVGVKNLLLMDGIEMNRPAYREKYNIKTKYRNIGTHYLEHNGTFISEHEEVVVSSNTFSYEDFLEIRYMNFMFFAVFNLKFQEWFFQFARHLGVYPSKFFSNFFSTKQSDTLPKKYIRFLNDLKSEIEEELSDSREEMVAKTKKIFEDNGKDVGDSSRINVNFGGRLNYQENEWIKPVLLHHLNEIMEGKLSSEDRDIASSLIDLAIHERVDIKNIGEKENLNIDYDVINWKENRFEQPLQNLRKKGISLKFSTEKNQALIINGFNDRFSTYKDKDYYCEAVENIRPRKFLLHNLSYN